MKLTPIFLASLIITSSPLLAAMPVVMHLRPNVIPTSFVPMRQSQALTVVEKSPLVFQPYLYNGGMDFSLDQSATTEGQGVFDIIATPNAQLNAQILPAASGFALDGHDIPDTHYPQITNTQFAGSTTVDNQGNFTADASGRFTLFTGAALLGYANTVAGLYVSNASLLLKITDRTTGYTVTAPYQIRFAYLQPGHIESLRSLVFPPIALNPNTPASQNVITDSPQSAKLFYSPTNATVDISTTTVCLTKNGGAAPSTCDCRDSSVPVVQVTLSDTVLEKYCDATTCRLFVGGNACYPANLPAGLYTGQGTIRMTYS